MTLLEMERGLEALKPGDPGRKELIQEVLKKYDIAFKMDHQHKDVASEKNRLSIVLEILKKELLKPSPDSSGECDQEALYRYWDEERMILRAQSEYMDRSIVLQIQAAKRANGNPQKRPLP